MAVNALEARDLRKSYTGVGSQMVLQDICFAVPEGSCVALLGASGSGKSTLLNCLGLLDHFESGELNLLGQNIAKLSDAERSRFRLEKIGFVFQFHHLIPELSAEENVALPGSMAGRKQPRRAAELLALMGLQDKLKRFPWQLSGGEQQRVALARALINEPRILLTDEATGNLDRERSHEILEILLKINRETGTTVLSVTHDEELAAKYNLRYRLKDGRIWDCVGA